VADISATGTSRAIRLWLRSRERVTIGGMNRKTTAGFFVGLCVVISGALSAQQSRPAAEPAVSRLTFAFELRARVGNPVEVGQVTNGRRRIVPIEGGTIEGAMLKGTVPAGAADW